MDNDNKEKRMIKNKDDSTIEIWCADYINKPHTRSEEDRNKRVIQIEHGYNNDYIVEVEVVDG